MGTVGTSQAPLPLEMLASSWVMNGREEELSGSCTKGGGKGRVLSVDRRVEESGSVPSLTWDSCSAVCYALSMGGVKLRGRGEKS